MSTHALASLTATYTDSEPEGEEEEDTILQDEKKTPEEEERETEVETEIPSKPSSPPQIQVSLEPTSRVTQLVSYHDDTALSDDEDGILEGREEGDETGFAGVELPPEPIGRCSPLLLEKLAKIENERVSNGLDMNADIQGRKDFRNPSIYEKLIQFCNLNEFGTNYPARIFDPLKWGKESYFEELARVQKLEMDKREKEKKERTKVEFVSGTKKINTIEDDVKKRKSKWDQVGTGLQGSGSLMIRPAGLLAPSLTTAATGTKSTVISAFGSLPKKPKI